MKEQLKIKENFSKFLENADLLTKAHSGKNSVILDDIFVYPELEGYDDSKSDFKKENTENLIKNFYQYSKILIAGENQSGKTTLCKKIFIELWKNDFIPIYVSDNKKQYAGKIQNKIKTEFEEQYEGVLFDAIDNEKIVPIVDDFHFAKNREKHINDLSIYKYSIIIVDDIFSLNFKDESLIQSFHQFRIKEFSPSLRNKLIEKWLNISDSKNIINMSQNGHYQKIDNTTELVNSSLGKIIGSGIMPAYPFFILSIISTHETLGSSIDKDITSQGYCYQTLIYLYLRKEGVKNDEIDTYINFLTVFSFFLYKENRIELSIEELKSFIASYKVKYNLHVKEDTLLEKLNKSKIIVIDNFGNYCFCYLYVYYFFVAKYISEHIDENKKTIDFIINHLHKDENSYIAVFISHHSKSTYILEEIKTNACCLFDKYKPAKLTKSELSFFDKKLEEIIKEVEVLPSNDAKPEIERTSRLKEQDGIESSSYKNVDAEYQEDDISIELRRSIKTVEVMGLIIKNRAGSLEKTELENMFEEAMKVYLRILTSFFETVEHVEEPIVNIIERKLASIIESKSLKRGNEFTLDRKDLETLSRKIFWNINFLVVHGLINKIIHSLGSNKLTEIIKTVCNKENTPVSFLIKHGILMWYNKNIQSDIIAPKIEEEEFSDTAKKIMKRMIINHCSMHLVNFKDKQRLAKKLDIKLIKLQGRQQER